MRTFRQWLRGDGKTALLNDPRKDLTITETVEKHAKENQDADARVVKIWRLYKTKKPMQAVDVDIAWVYENKGRMESALRELVGGGEFAVVFQNDRGRETRRFHYNLAGPNRAPKDEYEGDDFGKPKPLNLGDHFMALVNKVIETNMGQRLSPTEEIEKQKAQVEFIKAIKGDGEGEFVKEMAMTGYNNMASQKELGMENAMRMLEFMRTMQPSVEKEDPLVAIVQGLIPLVAQFWAAKQGIGPQLNAAQLQQLQQAPAQMQQLLQQSPQQLAQLGQTVPVPGPGEPAQAPAGNQGQAPPVAQDTVPSTPPASALDLMLTEFRHDVVADAEIPVLALALHQMVARAEYMAGIGAPHPMFAGLINQTDPMRLSHEFDRFCAAIPELKRKPDTAAAIKAAIAASYMPQPEPELEPQQPPAEPAGDMVGQDDAANHLDTAGQTPGPDQSGSDGNAADTDRADGPPIIRQPSKDDHAPDHV